MKLHIGMEHQPVYPASMMGKNQSWDSGPNVQTFPLTKNDCETKPHGRHKPHLTKIQATSKVGQQFPYNPWEIYGNAHVFFPKNQAISHHFPLRLPTAWVILVVLVAPPAWRLEAPVVNPAQVPVVGSWLERLEEQPRAWQKKSIQTSNMFFS